MELTDLYDLYSQNVLVLALSATRVAVAFLLLPLFSNELIPTLVRNSIFIALAILTIAIQPEFDVRELTGMQWASLFAKEAFIGITIGVFFGVYLWAFEAAGVLIDTQIGSSQAMIFDPLSGHEVTLFGEFFGLWANYLFLASGGLLLLTGGVLNSYVLFPIREPVTNFSLASVALFQSEFASFTTFTVMIASPVLVILFAIDTAMGLVNRYAQQLNVMFLSISLKSLAALILIVVLMPFMVELLRDQIAEHSANLEGYLKKIL